MPSSSATTWAIVVSMPWPCEPVPSETVTWPLGLDPHDGGLGAHRVHHPGARLDVEPEPDAEQPAFAAKRRLLGAEGVVADDLGRLFERLRRGDLVEDGNPVRTCTAARSVGMTLRRRHSRGSIPAARAAASTICSRATVSNIHGPRYAPRPHVLVHTASERQRVGTHW